MKKYKILHYDHFYKPGYDLKGFFIFDTKEEAEAFLAEMEDGKKQYPASFNDSEYILMEIDND